jgi:Ion channel
MCRYVFSFYWAITTIATVGYGDFHAASMPEAIFNLVFMLFTIGALGYLWWHAWLVREFASQQASYFRRQEAGVLSAGFNSYIIGTITLVVMKGDERTGHYRRCANNLKQYSKVNSVPKVRQDVSTSRNQLAVLWSMAG